MRFSDIIGQDDLKAKLIQSVRDNRVSHAQLFLSQQGYGALPLALAFAQYINCKNRSETDSCGTCPSCLKYQKLIHPDLHFIIPTNTTKAKTEKGTANFLEEWRNYIDQTKGYVDEPSWYDFIGIENKQGTIAVEEAQTLIHALSLKACEAEYRVAVIWMAERITEITANTLLKIIEEPPEKTVFILLAENQEDILPTIRSRAVLVKIPKIEEQVIVQKLIEKQGLSHDEASKIAHIADGNWKKAIDIINNTENDKQYFELFKTWMRLCFKAAVGNVIDFIDKEIKTLGRDRQKYFLGYCLNVVHNSLLLNNKTNELVLLSDEELQFMNNFSPFVNKKNYVQLANLFEESIRQIERNINASVSFLDDSCKIMKLLRMK